MSKPARRLTEVINRTEEQMRQIAQAGPPEGPMQKQCNAYGCEEPTITVIAVGGGTDGKTSQTAISLCETHAWDVLIDLAHRLHRNRRKEGKA